MVVQLRMLYSDAGGNMAGGFMIVNNKVCEDTVFQINLSEEESGMGFTFRELRGIEEGIRVLAGRIEGSSTRWHCDNWSACKIVEFGSMKRDCHVVAKRINVSFSIVWLSRESEEIRFADRVLKDFDFGDYRLSDGGFKRVVYGFGGFSADYFASDYSYRMRSFFSRYISERSVGSDAFVQDWWTGGGRCSSVRCGSRTQPSEECRSSMCWLT